MFGLGGQELLIIMLVALVVLGPQKLPDIARTMGRAMGEFNKAKMDLKRELNQAKDFQADAAVRAAARDTAGKEESVPRTDAAGDEVKGS